MKSSREIVLFAASGPLNRLRFSRFKAFSEEQTLQLRPVTLLFGYNSAGKSAALRALPILAAAALPKSQHIAIPSVFDYTSPALRGAAFADLVNAGYRGSSINFRLDWELSSFAFSVRSGTAEEGEFIANFEWWDADKVLTGHLSEERGEYTHDADLDGRIGKINLRGLVPSAHQPPQLMSAVVTLSAALRAFSSSVYWLSGTRSAPPRTFAFGPGTLNSIAPDGAGTAAALRASYYIGDGVADAVSRWLVDTCGSELAFAETDRQVSLPEQRFTFMLRSSTGAHIALSDVGEGIAQALPVVTLIHQARAGLLGPYPIVAVEQPELHLHPRASVRLAEEIVRCTVQGSPARHLIETHSESVLLAIQTAIVRGELAPSAVIVYWVAQEQGRSSLVPIEFDEKGYPSAGWPGSVFREALDQARRLNALRST